MCIRDRKGYSIIAMGANSISTDNGGCNIISLSTIYSGMLKTSLSSGSMPMEGEILINKAVADKLGENIIGQKVRLSLLIGEKKVKNEFIVSGIYQGSYGDFNSMIKCAFINYSDLEKIYSQNKKELKPNTAYITSTNEKYTDGIKSLQ